MLTIPQLNNLRAAAGAARQCWLQTKIPMELILAQWALESGWGSHAPGNNCFGIKEYPGCLGRQLLRTREYFTLEEKGKWLTAKEGRTADLEDATVTAGRQRYICQDWFATFPSLAYCFMKRAGLFHLGDYRPFTQKYLIDLNFAALVQGVAPIYATDPNYAKEILSIVSMPELQAAIKEAQNA